MTPAVQLSLGHLSPYDNYQLEFVPALGKVWNNLGPPFASTSSTATQQLISSGNVGLFRVKYMP